MSLSIELVEGSEHVEVNKVYDLLFCSLGLYGAFLAAKDRGGMDAFVLYQHLFYTARLQETNQVWANKTYLKRGLSWGDERVARAKALLKEMGLIELVQRQDQENGKWTKAYIKLNFLFNPIVPVSPKCNGPDTAIAADRTTGDRSTKCFKEQDKCLKEKVRGESPLLDALEKECKPLGGVPDRLREWAIKAGEIDVGLCLSALRAYLKAGRKLAYFGDDGAAFIAKARAEVPRVIYARPPEPPPDLGTDEEREQSIAGAHEKLPWLKKVVG